MEDVPCGAVRLGQPRLSWANAGFQCPAGPVLRAAGLNFREQTAGSSPNQAVYILLDVFCVDVRYRFDPIRGRNGFDAFGKA